MKKILLILATAALSLGSFAGNPDENKGRKNDPDKYCAESKDGVLKIMHNNEEITQDVTLSNGTKIHPDGRITREGGYTRILKAGECVNMDGEVDKTNAEDKSDEPLMNGKEKSGNFDKNNNDNMNRSSEPDQNGSTGRKANMNKGNADQKGSTGRDRNTDNTDKSKTSGSDEEPK